MTQPFQQPAIVLPRQRINILPNIYYSIICRKYVNKGFVTKQGESVEIIRRRIERQILELTGMVGKERDFEYPRKEPGLFGPQSAIWQVHGDFSSMMCGGVSALLLQMLHPLALAGIWDHSNFREDIFGRLRRTSQFISATTFGPTLVAKKLIAKIKGIHDKVEGVAPDGTPYMANDPDLLTWVHVAECSSFMASHLRYQRTIVSHERQMQYYRESGVIAAKLGARNIPITPRDISDYFQDMRPQLRCDERTREVAKVLLTAKLPGYPVQWIGRMMMNAGIDLLPGWAREMLGLRIGKVQRGITQANVHLVGLGLRACIRNGPYQCSMRRMTET